MPRAIVSCAGVALAAACAAVPRQTKVMSAAGLELSTQELRQRVYELGHRQEGMIEDAVTRISADAGDLAARRAAVTWALAAVPAVEEATLRPEPLVAVIDLWGFALQTQAWARDGPGRARLASGWIAVERASREMAAECERLVTLLLGPSRTAKLDDVRRRIERWADENPITSPTFARPTASVAWSGAFVEEVRGPVASFVASTDEQLALLSQRVAMLNGNLTKRIRWTLDLVVQDSLGKENAQALLDEADRDLAAQRRAAAAELGRERAEAFSQLARERQVIDAALNALVDRTRAETDAVVDRADARAQAIVDRADARASALLDRADARMRANVDHLLVGLALVGAALIVLRAALGTGARGSLPRRNPDPRP